MGCRSRHEMDMGLFWSSFRLGEVMKIELRTTENGYIVNVEDSIRFKGYYVFRSIDDLIMLEFVSRVVTDKVMKVEIR